MCNPNTGMEFIGSLLQTCRLAVLATEGNGQPHASLIAITPFRGFREMIFTTYRNTRKFENLKLNTRVAVLVQGQYTDSSGQTKVFALTAFGHAEELAKSELEEAVNAHRERHPDVANLLESSDSAIIRIYVEKYQIVRGIDDVTWFNVEDSGIL